MVRKSFPALETGRDGRYLATLANLVAALADPVLSRTWQANPVALVAVVDISRKDGQFELAAITDDTLALVRWNLEHLWGFAPVAPDELRAAVGVALQEGLLEIAPTSEEEYAAWVEVRGAISA